MPKNSYGGMPGGMGKNMQGGPAQPDPQQLMQMQQQQQQMPSLMAGVGQPQMPMPQPMPQEMNPVTPMPQMRGRVAPGMGMPPAQFQMSQGRVDPRQFAMQLAQMRAAQQASRPAGDGIAQYQANQAAKIQAIKAAAEKKIADAKAAKLRAKQLLFQQGAGQVMDPLLGGGDGGASGDGGGGDGGAGSAGAGE